MPQLEQATAQLSKIDRGQACSAQHLMSAAAWLSICMQSHSAGTADTVSLQTSGQAVVTANERLRLDCQVHGMLMFLTSMLREGTPLQHPWRCQDGFHFARGR